MPQFVILEHQRDGVHWDFMLEVGGILKTWAIDRPIGSGVEQSARLLPDHRLVYLDFEGEISNGRGCVVRVDRGVYAPTTWSADRIRVELRGEHFSGRVDLQWAEGQSDEDLGAGAWSFRFEEGNLDCKTLRDGNLGA